MHAQSSRVETFADFFAVTEPKLRESLMATLGGDAGADAAAEALEYGWANWNRVSAMDNPVGYLYKVGRSRGRRKARRRRPRFDTFETSRLPDVEPKLPVALSRLSERQRVVVVLVHCYEWTQSEVAEWLGLSRSSVRNHLERAMASLRRSIGGVS